GVTWWEARALPPGKFDPLGPGAVPVALCYVMAALGGLILLRVALGLAVGHARQSLLVGVHEDGEDLGYRRRPERAVATVALAVLYVLAMHRGWLSFLPATSAFLVVLGALLVERTPRAQAISFGVGLGTAVFLDLIFRRVLILDLP
ncbi:MAG: tripartite tricarboxylate transporter TctB family protein, partial [Candidatus Rokuibacteriota bacterium]